MATRVRSMRPLLSGWVAVYKPRGVFSMDCLAEVVKATGATKAGHCGTLDAPAEGVLPIALGGATRFIQYLQDKKVYETSIKFGTSTTSDDVTGSVLHQAPVPWLREHHVTALLGRFVGTVKQRPPQFSAIHVQGQRLHKVARDATQPLPLETIPEKEVVIHRITPTAFRPGQFPEIDLTVECRSGTYIRSIARDLGLLIAGPPEHDHADALPALSHQPFAGPDAGIGAVTRVIRRVNSSGFGIEHCTTPQSVSRDCVLPVEAPFAHLPSVDLHVPDCGECHNDAIMPNGQPCPCIKRQLELWQSGAQLRLPGAPGECPIDLARVYARVPLASVVQPSSPEVPAEGAASSWRGDDTTSSGGSASRHFIGLGSVARRVDLPDTASDCEPRVLRKVHGAPLPFEPVKHRRKKGRRGGRRHDKDRQRWSV